MRFRRLAASAALLLAACTATAFAGTTGQVEGRITDTQGRPLANASITLASTGVRLFTKSDEHGHYHFLSLYPDDYVLTVNRSGNMSFVSMWFEVQADQTTTCNVRLDPALTGLYAMRPKGTRVVPCMF
ncbi:MAG: carboxypeptidase regulatory-like domain-containing protein [Candidatus Eremiobacteraeota bacterium]|nr:carboxypeptidase regulatory-like domain-containing protein [Candidatus Eremiobacteraeota bacterium]